MPNSHLAGEAINLKNQNIKSHDKYTYIAGAQLNLQKSAVCLQNTYRHMVESTFLYISYRSNKYVQLNNVHTNGMAGWAPRLPHP